MAPEGSPASGEGVFDLRQQTASRNRIHAIADQLFPGFLDAPRSGMGSFTEASLALMEDRFSAPEIARRRHSSLSSMLCRHGIRDHDEAAAKLIEFARQALPPNPARVPTLQRTLAAAVDLHRCLHRNALELRREAAQSLAATPYALLTSVPGIGMPYLPPPARASDPDPAELEAGVRATWEVLTRKWRTVPGGLDLITDEENPVGFWRRTLRELHGIQLPRGP